MMGDGCYDYMGEESMKMHGAALKRYPIPKVREIQVRW